VSNQHEVAASELPFEFMLNVLRLREGFETKLFTERTGLSWPAVHSRVEEAVQRGWLSVNAGQVAPTARGFDFLSDVQQLFL
jgi:coproporphyrinogen III oxidase-like Fe-S oxidoreductase